MLVRLVSVLCAVLVGSTVGMVPTSAATTQVRVEVTYPVAIFGEQVKISGIVGSAVARSVQLQRDTGLEWLTVAMARSASSGRFEIRTPPAAVGRYRVFIPSVRVLDRRLSEAASAPFTIRRVTQTGAIEVPDRADSAFIITTRHNPARPGRPVVLERRLTADGAWTAVGQQLQPSSGANTWSVPGPAEYRVRTDSWNGAPALTTTTAVRAIDADEIWPVDGSCREVVWIGARGSGENAWEGKGMGFEVGEAWADYRTGTREGQATSAGVLPGMDTAFIAVRYPALASDAVKLVQSPTYRKAFAASISAGVDEVVDILRMRAGRCSGERYVLAGFSQGAMVMHRAVHVFEDAGQQNLLDRIDGVLAIADGDKIGFQGGLRYGTAGEDAYGISWMARFPGVTSDGVHKADGRKVSTTRDWSKRFHDVCMAGDAVCDWGTAFAELWPPVGPGFDLHGSAYWGSGVGRAEVARATRQIVGLSRDMKYWVPRVLVRHDMSCTVPTIDVDNSLGGGGPWVEYVASISATTSYGGSLGPESLVAGAFEIWPLSTAPLPAGVPVSWVDIDYTVTRGGFVVAEGRERVSCD